MTFFIIILSFIQCGVVVIKLWLLFEKFSIVCSK